MTSKYGKKVAHEPLGGCASVSYNAEKKKLIRKKKEKMKNWPSVIKMVLLLKGEALERCQLHKP